MHGDSEQCLLDVLGFEKTNSTDNISIYFRNMKATSKENKLRKIMFLVHITEISRGSAVKGDHSRGSSRDYIAPIYRKTILSYWFQSGSQAGCDLS